MILLGIVYGAVTGNMQAVTDAAFASAKDAVTLCITMTGMMALWVGVMEIARGAGLIRKWSEKLKPFIHFLFPGIPKGHKAQEYIAANMIANILGLGSAATPAGLKAMEELAEKSGGFHYEMICDIGKRIPRVYLKDGKVVGTKDYFDDVFKGFE